MNKFYFTCDHFGSEASETEIREAIEKVPGAEYGISQNIFHDEVVTDIDFDEQDYLSAYDEVYEKILTELSK